LDYSAHSSRIGGAKGIMKFPEGISLEVEACRSAISMADVGVREGRGRRGYDIATVEWGIWERLTNEKSLSPRQFESLPPVPCLPYRSWIMRYHGHRVCGYEKRNRRRTSTSVDQLLVESANG
jgi:hypothetical protein